MTEFVLSKQRCPADVREVVDWAVTKTVLENMFYATMLLGNEVYYPEEGSTAFTNGKNIFIPVPHIKAIKRDDLVVSFKHELLHLAMLHVVRKQNRQPELWNIAIDIVVNGIIRRDKTFNKLLPTDVFDPALEDLSAEEIYNKMIENLPQSRGGGMPDQQSSNGQGGQQPEKFAGHTPEEWLDMADGGGPQHYYATMTEAEASETSMKVKAQVAKAMTLEKQVSAGASGSPLMKMLAKLLEPKVDWQSKLRDFVVQAGTGDYTFASPHRRYMAHGFYMPTDTGFEIGRIAILFDTSGSIYCHQELVNQFASEVNAICEDVKPRGLDVLYVDTKVAGHDRFEHGEDFVPDLRGGGGTAFKKAFEYIQELDEPPEVVIVLTDMGIFDLHECQCDIPTLWMDFEARHRSGPVEVPFGVVTPIEL